MDNIPEKFKNSDGSLNADALMKSYYELERKLGTMITIPTDESDADTHARFRRAIGVPASADEYPIDAVFDDANLRQKFLEIGLTSSQVEKIYSIANEFLSPVISELFNTQSEKNAMIELEKFFGSREKMQDALQEINTFGNKFLPADAFDALCSTSQGIQGVYRMMQSMEPHVNTDSVDMKNLTDSDLRRMMRDPKYWRDGDAEYIRKIENGFRKLYSQ